MNRRSALSLAALVALGVSTSLQATEPNSDSEKAVLALEDQWLEAEKQHQTRVAVPLLAKSYVSTGPDAKLEDKTQTLADMEARHYAAAEYEDMKAAVFGETAIVRGVYRGTGTEKDGKQFKERLRFTDTWIKMAGGKWLCIASQYTVVPE
jgi:ketosteroid isomerase-like protein